MFTLSPFSPSLNENLRIPYCVMHVPGAHKTLITLPYESVIAPQFNPKLDCKLFEGKDHVL